MMRKLHLLCFSLLFLSAAAPVQAQIKTGPTGSTAIMPPVRTCGTPELPADYEHWIQPLISAGAPRAVYTLPVVVHVIYNNGEAVGSGNNISAAQIQSQINIMNQDYRKLNADVTGVPSVWTSRVADCQINFCLAQTDPSGNPMPEPGIHRVNRNTAGFSAPPYSDTYTDATIKPATIWNPNQYLNIWVLNLGGGLLGYATFPAGSTLPGLSAPYGTATSDGVVILNSAFGNIGSAAAPYNLGRTVTHELGHWLGLRHIGGDATGGCGNDYCTDTPAQKGGTTAAGTGNGYGQNYGCPTHPLTYSGECSGTTAEMFMNYMDYVNDACMYMFTTDQATRIQTVMANSPMRVALATSTKCNPPFALDAGINAIVSPTGSTCVSTINPVVTLKNFGSTTLTSVTINYQLDAGGTSTFAWTGSLTTGSSTNVALPAMSVGVGAHTYTAFTSAPNGGTDGFNTNNSTTGNFTIIATPAGAALPFTEGFQATTFVPAGWTLVNPDANGTWTRTTTAGGFGTSTASARFDNLTPATSIAGQSDYMITPAISFAAASGTLQMSFDVAYARYDATFFDSLNVYITTNCGATWTRVYNKGGTTLATAPDNNTSTFVPTAAQWRTDIVNLNSYIGLNPVQFRFENKSGWGQMLYLDNINLSFTPGGPTANFTGSPTTVCAGQSVTFTNTSTGSPTSYAWTFAGGTPGTSTAANPTVTYNTAGTYNVTLVATNGSGSDSEVKTGYITVTALPTATATNTGPVCAGSSFTISTPAVTGATYAWTGPLGYTSTTRNPIITGATAAMAGTYTVTVTAGGCSSTSSTTVTVNPAPTATATNTGGYCVGQTISLNTPTVAGATYAWAGPGGYTSSTQNPTRTGATVGMAGTYTVTVTAGGCSASSSTTVTVAALPTATATNTGPVCAGSSFTISTPAVTGATYAWSGPAGYTSTTRNPTITGSTTAMSGVYTVTVSNGGCSNTSSTTVTVNPAPTATATNTGGYCVGQTISLNTPTVAGATYAWTGPGGYTSSTQNPTRTGATVGMAGTYTVTVTAGGCSATSSTTVTVAALPTATATNTGPVCAGASFTISTPAVTGATYAWSGPAGYTSTTRNPTITGSTTAMSGVYTVTVSNGGCSNTSSTTVTVNPAPTAAAANTGAYCVGQTINLSTTTIAGATYAWTGPGGYTSSTQNPTRTGATAAMGGTYTVTVTVGTCTATSSTTVTVNTLPNAAASNTGPVCEGQNFIVTTPTVGGCTYAWTGPAGFTSAIRNPTITGATTAMSGVYTVTVTRTSTGCSNTSSTTVVVNPGPTSSATNTGPVCEGTAFNLNTPTVASATYAWSGPGGYTSTAQNPVISSPTGSSSGAYTVTVTVGSCSTTSTTTATVTPLPLASAGNDGPVCTGSPLNLSTTTVAGATYAWTGPGGFTSSGEDPAIPSASTGGAYTVTVTASGCSNTSSTVVTVNPLPNAAATNDGPVCEGGIITLGTPTVAGAAYSWTGPGAYASGIQNPSISPAGTASTGTYTVTVTDANGCTGTSATSITVNPSPAANAGTDVSVCPGESVTLNASGGGTYNWTPAATLSSATVANPTATPSGTTQYIVTVSDGTCSDTDSINVTVYPAPPVPSISRVFDTLTASPSTGGYTYQWYLNGSPISGANSATYVVTGNGDYTVEITDANGCTSLSGSYLFTSTGIALNGNGNSFTLYPNPSNGWFTLNFSQAVEGDCQLSIVDGIGRLVHSSPVKTTGKNNAMDIQTNHLARGTYTVVVTNGNSRYYQKLVINY